MHRERDPGLWYRTRALDLKYVGVPGIVNFVDARTQWVDDGMARALDGGVRQVRAARARARKAEMGWWME